MARQSFFDPDTSGQARIYRTIRILDGIFLSDSFLNSAILILFILFILFILWQSLNVTLPGHLPDQNHFRHIAIQRFAGSGAVHPDFVEINPRGEVPGIETQIVGSGSLAGGVYTGDFLA